MSFRHSFEMGKIQFIQRKSTTIFPLCLLCIESFYSHFLKSQVGGEGQINLFNISVFFLPLREWIVQENTSKIGKKNFLTRNYCVVKTCTIVERDRKYKRKDNTSTKLSSV